MRTFSHLYGNLSAIGTLLQAWNGFKQGKRGKPDVALFERHLEDNLFALHHELRAKTYKHGDHDGFYVTNPKVRHIHKATVRDRIVHHALFVTLNPLFEPMFITDSYSCRIGYGTHKGFQKLVVYTRKVSQNYTKDCWALKCGIWKFFDSINHAILLAIMEKRIKDPDVLWLLKEIVESYHTQPGKGVPIGNLTSQLFANIYLNELDQFVKQKLRVKYYLRYADDFILLNPNKALLEDHVVAIKSFLEGKLALTLHPNKTVFRKLSWGIDFVGYIALPHYQLVRTTTRRRLTRKIEENVIKYKHGDMSATAFQQSMQSYLGILKHANTHVVEQNLLRNIAFWLSD